MPLTIWNCVLSRIIKRRIISVKLVFFSYKKLLSKKNSQVATFCYLLFNRWQMGFEAADLLLATVNFKP